MTESFNIIIEKAPVIVLGFGGKLLVALIIYMAGQFIAKKLVGVLKKVLDRSKMDPTIVQFLGNITYGILLIFIILAAIARLGVQTTSFIAIIGAATLAVGMALQGTLGNFSSGVMLMIFKPFKIGDSVIAGGVTGIVHDIGIFQTTLVPSDGRKVVIPNGKLSNDTITNFSSMPTRRVEISISVPGTNDIDAIRGLLKEIVESEPDTLNDPPPSITLTDANAGSIVFAVNVHVKNTEYAKTYASLLERIKLALNAKGIWA